MLKDSSLKAWEELYESAKKEKERSDKWNRDYKERKKNTNYQPGDKLWYDYWNDDNNEFLYLAVTVIRKSYVPLSNSYIVKTGSDRKYRANWYDLTEIGE